MFHIVFTEVLHLRKNRNRIAKDKDREQQTHTDSHHSQKKQGSVKSAEVYQIHMYVPGQWLQLALLHTKGNANVHHKETEAVDIFNLEYYVTIKNEDLFMLIKKDL